MKVQQELELSKITSWRNVRSDLASEVQKYWLNKKSSNIGLQYLRLKNGIIHANEGSFERKDLFVFQHPRAFNVFVEPDCNFNWNLFDGIEVTTEEQKRVEQHILQELGKPENAAYMEHERRFFQSKPWMQVDGMTPEQAIAKFAELGWPATS